MTTADLLCIFFCCCCFQFSASRSCCVKQHRSDKHGHGHGWYTNIYYMCRTFIHTHILLLQLSLIFFYIFFIVCITACLPACLWSQYWFRSWGNILKIILLLQKFVSLTIFANVRVQRCPCGVRACVWVIRERARACVLVCPDGRRRRCDMIARPCICIQNCQPNKNGQQQQQQPTKKRNTHAFDVRATAFSSESVECGRYCLPLTTVDAHNVYM